MEESIEALRNEEKKYTEYGEFYYVNFYGINLFFRVVHVYDDETCEITEIKSKVLTEKNLDIKVFRKLNPEEKGSPTGKYETLRDHYYSNPVPYKYQNLWCRFIRVPFIYNEEEKEGYLMIQIAEYDPVFKKAKELKRNEGMTIEGGIVPLKRIGRFYREQSEFNEDERERICSVLYVHEWEKTKLVKEIKKIKKCDA